MSNRSDMLRVVKKAIRRGWVLAVKANAKMRHIKLRYTDGSLAVCAATPSDVRAVKNFEAELRRAERRAVETRDAEIAKSRTAEIKATPNRMIRHGKIAEHIRF